MPKSKNEMKATESAASKAATKLVAADNSVDPVLAALFASSSGPVKIPVKTAQPAKASSAPVQQSHENDTSSSGSDTSDDGDNESKASEASSENPSSELNIEAPISIEKTRKRKRAADEDDLEGAYFKRLQREEEKEIKQKHEAQSSDNEDTGTSSDEDEESSKDDSDDDSSLSQPSDVEVPPRHEIFDKKLKNDEDKLARTVFLGNVSTSAIKSKSSKRILTRHLRSVLKTPAHGPRLGKFESIRFRSTAYAAKSGPKKATFAKKELMDATTTSTNAYAVFTTEAAAEHVATKLNGTIVLDRHLRVDYLAKPLPIEHKRCVFIGNLSFVNEETQPEPQDGEKQQRRPTAKQPADAEEGLWRTFSKCGPVESVRVVRDQETRVSKGFAYVQFKDENGVEAALLMNEKKFPPMLPRKLRVMRARKMKVKSTTSTQVAFLSRTKAGAKPSKSSLARGKKGKPIVFEGHRATEGAGTKKVKPQSLKDRKERRNSKRPDSKSARRGAHFKQSQMRKRRLGDGK